MKVKILCLVACGFAPMIAGAQTETLDYTGAAFTPVSINGHSGISNVTGEIVLSAPLGANLTNATVVPVSWSFNDPNLNSTLAGTTDSFAFTTVNGVITGWNIDVSFSNTVAKANTFSSIILNNVGGDTYTTGYSAPASKCKADPDPCFSLTQTTTHGSFSVVGAAAAAPEIDPASAFSGLAMLAGGLLVLRGRRGLNVA
jgi:hypothetical protein